MRNSPNEITMQYSAAAEHTPSAAAEKIEQITQAQIGARIAAHGEALEIAGLPAIGTAAVFHPVQCVHIFHVIRLHADGLADMLHGGDLIAQTVIGQSAEIVPPCSALGAVVQGVQRLLIPPKTDVIIRGCW